MNLQESKWRQMNRWERTAICAGVAGLAICLLAAFWRRAAVFQAYWFAWIFWSGLGFGCLALLFLRHLAPGDWGNAIQRPAEACVMTLPLTLILLIPALFGLHEIFPWTRPEIFAGHDWPHKRAWLQIPWFILRSFVYFGILLGLAFLLRLWSRLPEREAAAATRVAPALRGLSGVGAVLYFICMVFASTDWVLSLEPEWYSTMFVVIFATTQFLSALAFSVLCVALLGGSEPLRSLLTPKHLHDLGNLLLAFVIFWAYVSFSQFMLIWMGNLPREISWYLHRRSGGWLGVAITLALLQFAIPFALLLMRINKRNRVVLGPIAALVLLASVLNVYWLVAPAWHPEGLHFPWLELAAFCGMGGVWIATFLFFLKRQPLLAPALNREEAHV